MCCTNQNYGANIATQRTSSVKKQIGLKGASGLAGMVALAALFSLTSAFAAPPYHVDLVSGGNKWFLDAYDDTDPDHVALATQGLCFEYAGVVGSHQQYTWYSDTFLGWRGTASQDGDQVFMYGRYAKGDGHDAMQIRFIIDSPRNGAVGHWQEWRESGTYGETVGFANARMIRDGDCTLSAREALGGGWYSFPIPLPGYYDNPMTKK